MLTLLCVDLLIAAWCALWAVQEDLEPAEKLVYGLAAGFLTGLFVLGLVRGVWCPSGN